MRDRVCRIEENLLQRTAGPYIWVIGLNRSRGRAVRQARRSTASARGRPVLKMRVVRNLTQDRSIPMTDEAMSPLRQRMIEDMTIRMIASKTHQGYQRL